MHALRIAVFTVDDGGKGVRDAVDMAIIEVEHLVKRYSSSIGVQDVSFLAAHFSRQYGAGNDLLFTSPKRATVTV